jgi:hypothetical protein
MITVYSLSLNIYEEDLIEISNQYPSSDHVLSSYVRTEKSWLLNTGNVLMTGTFKGKRLKVLSISPQTEYGVEIIRRVAKLCKGTVIAVVTHPIKHALYITKGNEELNVTLLTGVEEPV